MSRFRRAATICIVAALPLVSAGFVEAAVAAPAVADDADAPVSAAGNGIPDECDRTYPLDPRQRGAICWGGGRTKRFQAIVHCSKDPAGINHLGPIHGLEVESFYRCPRGNTARTVGVNTWS